MATFKRSNAVAEVTPDFTVAYTQDAVNSVLRVSATTGNIVVTDSNGNQINISTTQELVLNQITPRVAFVSPIDGDVLVTGTENMLCWTKYNDPAVAGYLIEYNLPSATQPVFSQDNVTTPEYATQTISYTLTDLTTYGDLCITMLYIGPEIAGKTVEARVFPIDNNGATIASAVSSDRVTVTGK